MATSTPGELPVPPASPLGDDIPTQVGKVKTYGVAFTVALALAVAGAALNVYQWVSSEPQVSVDEPMTPPAATPTPFTVAQLTGLANEVAALVDDGRKDVATNLMVAAEIKSGCNLVGFTSFSDPGDLSSPDVRAHALEVAAERRHTLGFGNSGDTWIGVAQDCGGA